MAKKPKQTIHPLAMVGALEALNQTINLYMVKVAAAASMLERLADKPAVVRRLATELTEATEAAQAAIYPADPAS